MGPVPRRQIIWVVSRQRSSPMMGEKSTLRIIFPRIPGRRNQRRRIRNRHQNHDQDLHCRGRSQCRLALAGLAALVVTPCPRSTRRHTHSPKNRGRLQRLLVGLGSRSETEPLLAILLRRLVLWRLSPRTTTRKGPLTETLLFEACREQAPGISKTRTVGCMGVHQSQPRSLFHS